MANKLNLGIVGCGVISAAYFKGCAPFDAIDIVACADLFVERAQARAEEFGVPRACSVDEIMADPNVDLIVNLTIPNAHAEVNIAALQAGKHAYCEKPLAINRDDGLKTLAAAKEAGLRVGSVR